MGDPTKVPNPPIRDGALIDLARHQRAVHCVCLVLINRRPAGTGFLVGPDVVLTNFHVVEPALRTGDGQTFTYSVSCQFDFNEHEGGGFDEGRVVDVMPRILHSSRYAQNEVGDDPNPADPPAGDNELDYALLKLAEPFSKKPPPDSLHQRGWLTLRRDQRALAPQSPLQLIQHPLKAAKVTCKASYVGANGANRVVYDGETHPGSSGAPCLNDDWEVFALHHYGDPLWQRARFKQGIPIWLIYQSLAAGGLASHIPIFVGDDVDQVDRFLWALNEGLTGTARGQLVGRWRNLLTDLKIRLARLEVYKSLHEYLCNWQQQWHTAEISARGGDARGAVSWGRSLSSQLENARAKARTLPDGELGARQEQLSWVEEIESAAVALAKAAITLSEARTLLSAIRSEIRIRSVTVDQRLVDEAKGLPLERLSNLLAEVGVAGMAHALAGSDALKRLSLALRHKTSDHNGWQYIDNILSGIENPAFESWGSRKTFAREWKRAWDKIRPMCESSGEEWARTALGDGRQLNEQIAPTLGEDWQKIETILETLESAPVASGESIEAAANAWSSAWERLRLASQDRQEPWAKLALAEGQALDKRMASASQGEKYPAETILQLKRDLRKLIASYWSSVKVPFDDFRDGVLKKFSEIDRALLADCHEILRINDPLTALLGEPR